MDCIIPGNNLKVLSKALQALSKIGDELFIEAKSNQLSLITVNTSKTTCGRFSFFDTFFTCYQINNNNTNNNNDVTCKVHLKVVLPLFKGNLERKLDYFKIDYELDNDFIIFKMKYCCDNIIMEHKLRLMDNETLTIGSNLVEKKSNFIQTSSNIYQHLLTTFSIKDDEIIFDIKPNKLTIRNYCPGVGNQTNKLRTQINLNSNEFQIYQIDQATTINFTLKPLRSLINFADNFNLNIDLNFDVGNQPVVFVLKNPTFVVDCIVATVDPYNNPNCSLNTSILTNNLVIGGDKLPNCSNNNNNNNVGDNGGNKENINGDNSGKEMEESPQLKRAKTVFSRCYDETFHSTILGDVLAENSDTD